MKTEVSESGIKEYLPGQIPPLGYFDPLHLSDGLADKELIRYREAELKHGRIAMLVRIILDVFKGKYRYDGEHS